MSKTNNWKFTGLIKSKIGLRSASLGVLWMTAMAPTSLLAQNPEGSVRVGNGGSPVSDPANLQSLVMNWCRNRLSLIQQIISRATYNKLEGLPRSTIIGIYTNGLVELAKDFPSKNAYSLTHRSVVRGIELAAALEHQFGTTEQDDITRLYFLETYFQHLIRISETIDIPVYIPTYNIPATNCAGCPNPVSEEILSKNLINLGLAQLTLPLEKLAEKSGNRVFPKGNTGAFLRVLEFVTSYTAHDLFSSLAAPRFACVIGDLQTLNRQLSSYNNGDRSVFAGRDDWAVSQTYESTLRIVRDLQSIAAQQYTRVCDPVPVITPGTPQNPGYTYPRPIPGDGSNGGGNNGVITPRP